MKVVLLASLSVNNVTMNEDLFHLRLHIEGVSTPQYQVSHFPNFNGTIAIVDSKDGGWVNSYGLEGFFSG